jgi:hypothetical protein
MQIIHNDLLKKLYSNQFALLSHVTYKAALQQKNVCLLVALFRETILLHRP